MPNGRKREMLARTFQNAKVFLIKPTEEKCKENAYNDRKRVYPNQYADTIIADWYSKYTCSNKDIVINDFYRASVTSFEFSQKL